MPLHNAVTKNRLEAVQLLLARGASLTAKDAWGETALDSAKSHKWEDLIKLPEGASYWRRMRASL